MTEIGIILLNHKSSYFLESLYSNISDNISIDFDKWLFLIVDNSIDNNESIIIRKFANNKKNVKVIFSKVNKGYAHGNNLGLNYLYEHKINYGLIINPDIIFLTPNFFYDFLNIIKTNESICIVGPKLIDSYGKEISLISKMNIINAVIDYNPKYSDSISKNVYATIGCCLFIDILKFKQINFLDERTFLYREEQILAEKLIKNKMLWFVIPGINVIHNHVRKVQNPKKLLAHKIHEFNSTKIYFKEYLNYKNIYVFIYSILFFLKTILHYGYVLIINIINEIKKNRLGNRSL
jgi:N-acetylglucosaminyl-diphospho-decaprenol L-rhamnosyltransferase